MNKNWLKYCVFAISAFLVACDAQEMDESYDSMSKEEAATEEKAVYEEVEVSDSYHDDENYVEDSVGLLEPEAIIEPEIAKVLEERASQKVKELFDYMLIASNPEYDTEMRRKAMKMAITLFEDGARVNSLTFTGKEGAIKVKSILKMIFNGKISIKDIQITSINVNDKIQCEMVLNTDQNIFLTIDFTMKKEAKQFGNTTQEVWAVYLGDIIEN